MATGTDCCLRGMVFDGLTKERAHQHACGLQSKKLVCRGFCFAKHLNPSGSSVRQGKAATGDVAWSAVSGSSPAQRWVSAMRKPIPADFSDARPAGKHRSYCRFGWKPGNRGRQSAGQKSGSHCACPPLRDDAQSSRSGTDTGGNIGWPPPCNGPDLRPFTAMRSGATHRSLAKVWSIRSSVALS